MVVEYQSNTTARHAAADTVIGKTRDWSPSTLSPIRRQQAILVSTSTTRRSITTHDPLGPHHLRKRKKYYTETNGPYSQLTVIAEPVNIGRVSETTTMLGPQEREIAKKQAIGPG
jgi:hypothetical protein